MSFAPHTNTDVRNARAMGHTAPALVLGCFEEKDGGALFEFGQRGEGHGDLAPDFDQVIYVNGGTRLARVLKTVAYVVTDEDADGNPVTEKWSIKGHRVYDLSWM